MTARRFTGLSTLDSANIIGTTNVTGGLIDTFVTTAIKLGDAVNTALSGFISTSIIGALNELRRPTFLRTEVDSATSNIDGQSHVVGVTYTSTGAVTLTITSDAIASGFLLHIKDEGGNAGTNNITIATEGAETIDGQVSITVNADYNKVSLYSNGSNVFIQGE